MSCGRLTESLGLHALEFLHGETALIELVELLLSSLCTWEKEIISNFLNNEHMKEITVITPRYEAANDVQ